MSDFFIGLKTLIVAVFTSVSAIVPANSANLPEAASGYPSPAAVTTVPTASPSQNLAPKESPLPLNGENYIYVQGTYSYLGQAVKYLFLVPRMGGDFSGAIQGACQAQAGGNYEGGDGGKISGSVGGACSMFGVKTKGSTKFSGRLYPDTKTVELDIDNSPIHGFTIKYD